MNAKTKESFEKLCLVIKEKRVSRNWSVGEAARRADISKWYLSKLEKGQASPHRGNIVRVVRVLFSTEEERFQPFRLIRGVCSRRSIRREDIRNENRKGKKMFQRIPKRNKIEFYLFQ